MINPRQYLQKHLARGLPCARETHFSSDSERDKSAMNEDLYPCRPKRFLTCAITLRRMWRRLFAFKAKPSSVKALSRKTKQLIAVAVAHVNSMPLYHSMGTPRAQPQEGATGRDHGYLVAAEMRAGGAYAHSAKARPGNTWTAEILSKKTADNLDPTISKIQEYVTVLLITDECINRDA